MREKTSAMAVLFEIMQQARMTFAKSPPGTSAKNVTYHAPFGRLHHENQTNKNTRVSQKQRQRTKTSTLLLESKMLQTCPMQTRPRPWGAGSWCRTWSQLGTSPRTEWYAWSWWWLRPRSHPWAPRLLGSRPKFSSQLKALFVWGKMKKTIQNISIYIYIYILNWSKYATINYNNIISELLRHAWLGKNTPLETPKSYLPVIMFCGM